MVNLTCEQSLLQEIEHLAGKGKIHDSAGLTKQVTGSMLTDEVAKSTLEKLIPTTRQRLNATKFYLDLMDHTDYAPYLIINDFPSTEQKPIIDFSGSNLIVEIKLVDIDTLYLVLFVVLHGFFSNLTGTEDCLAKVINIVYDLIPYDKHYLGSDMRKKLKNKIPNGRLIHHLRTFHPITRKNGAEVEHKKGSPFNISKLIRNKFTHDDITDIIEFPSTKNLSGAVADSNLKLFFDKDYFPANTPREDTEVITFCHKVFKETVDFVDECYKLILGKLRHSGCLPIK